jgi:hypothetical protein
MTQLEKTIIGEQLLADWRMDEYDLSYLIMKHGLTILESSRIPIIGRFLKPRQLPADSEELFEIIRNAPERLRTKLFIESEIKIIKGSKKVTPENVAQTDTPLETSGSESVTGHPPISESAPGEARGSEHCSSRVRYMTTEQLERAMKSSSPQLRKSMGILSIDLLKATIESHEASLKKSQNVFSLLGKAWFVKYSEREWGIYPDQEKYRYIAHVLGLCDGYPRPGDTEYSIYNTDLCARVKGEPAGNKFTGADSSALKDLTEADLSNSDLSDKLSVEDIWKFREMGQDLLEQLRDARDAGNQDRIKTAKDNIDAYHSHLSNEYGIIALVSTDEKKVSFKIRHRPSKELEKLRQLVKNQISKAIKDFDTMPRFKSHLEHSVKMKSNKTIYSPEQTTSWYVSL